MANPFLGGTGPVARANLRRSAGLTRPATIPDTHGHVLDKSSISPACFTIPMSSTTTRNRPPTPTPNRPPTPTLNLNPNRPSIRTTFSRLCRQTRIRLGMSQETLALAVGVSRGQIAKIELGIVDPSLDMAEGIARALGLEVDLTARLTGAP